VEATGGYKGYGLALAVDLLTGVLSGSGFGPNILGLFSTEGPSDVGQTFVVLDPGAIDVAGSFERRLEGYLDQLTAARTIPDAPGRVLVPGEPEANAERRAAERGVIVDRAHAAGLHELGVRFGVPFPVRLPGVP
jgi:LDH2 family malate/lactate/ureidoglycolate dehydrogenase